MHNKIKTAKILLDAFPFIQKFNGEKIVIKYGGSAQNNISLKNSFARDIVLLQTVGLKPIIVHGGGKDINNFLDRLNIKSSFINGERITTKENIDIIEMVLSGKINKEIVSLLSNHNGKSIGISGKDGKLVEAIPKDNRYNGNIKKINPEILNNIINDGYIPVISPISFSQDKDFSSLNINADIVASEISIMIAAKKIIFLSDTNGILDRDMNIIHTLNFEDIEILKKEGIIHGGMIPKVDASIKATSFGVEKAHIIDGRILHSILLELFTLNGIGTCIYNYDKKEKNGS